MNELNESIEVRMKERKANFCFSIRFIAKKTKPNRKKETEKNTKQ